MFASIARITHELEKLRYDHNDQRLAVLALDKEQISDLVDSHNEVIKEVISNLDNVSVICDKGTWRHLIGLSANDKLTYSKTFGESTADMINNAARHYFSQDVVRIQELDWFYVDVLIAYTNKRMVMLSESIGGDIFAGAFTHGLRMLFEKQVAMGAAFIIGKLLLWVLYAAAILIPLSIKGENYWVISLAVSGYVLLENIQTNRDYMQLKIKTFERIWTISRVYTLTEYPDFYWDVLAKELDASRRDGIPWLSALDTAVKHRL